jgi:hypothetical protein
MLELARVPRRCRTSARTVCPYSSTEGAKAEEATQYACVLYGVRICLLSSAAYLNMVSPGHLFHHRHRWVG